MYYTAVTLNFATENLSKNLLLNQTITGYSVLWINGSNLLVNLWAGRLAVGCPKVANGLFRVLAPAKNPH